MGCTANELVKAAQGWVGYSEKERKIQRDSRRLQCAHAPRAKDQDQNHR